MTQPRTRWASLAAMFLLAGMGVSAHAQKMYRCGNTYQDRPCMGEQQGKVIGSTGTPRPAVASATADPYCAQRGATAQKIMWAKEAGRTEEMQLSAATGAEERKLIGDVYRKRGSSVEVRTAIEADCTAERQRAAQAAALIEAAAKLQGQDKPVAAAAPAAATATNADSDAAARRQQEAAARQAADKKTRCDRLAGRLEQIRNSQRSGGSAATMDSLRQQLQKAEKEWGDAGC